MSDYPNLDMMQIGGCGPTSDWIKVIPEVKAALAEIQQLKDELHATKEAASRYMKLAEQAQKEVTAAVASGRFLLGRLDELRLAVLGMKLADCRCGNFSMEQIEKAIKQ